MDEHTKDMLRNVVTTLIKGDTQACKDAFSQYAEMKVKSIADKIK